MTHYNDNARNALDIDNATKADLNNALLNPLSAPVLKKTSRADLVAMVEAQDAEPTPPTLTNLEKRVTVAYLEAGIDCNGAKTLDDMLADNMTWGDVPAIAKRTGLTQKQVKPVIASLNKKGLLVITEEAVNGEGPVQQCLSDDGIRLAFELPKPKSKAKDKKPAKAERKPRELKPHVYCRPVAKPENVTSLTEGSKKHKLAAALLKGATMEQLMEAAGWNRWTVQSAFSYDMKNSGFGVERRADQKYYLLIPKGLKRLPVMSKGQTRADALVAACN